MKKSIVFMVFCSFVSCGFADWTRLDVCTAGGNQYNASIDGSLIVWQDTRTGNANIMARRMPNTAEISICTEPGDQANPSVCGDMVVWQDNRSGSYDIYAFDLSKNQTIVICNAAGDQINPDIYGRIIIWQDYRNGIANGDLYGYNLDAPEGQREFVICDDPSNQIFPAISGNRVVFADDRAQNNDIYGIDLSNLAAGEFVICDNTAAQDNPDIYGTMVVWQDGRTDTADIYARNLSGGSEFPVCAVTERQTVPSVFGNWIVWRDRRAGSTNYDIYAYNISTGQTEAVCTLPNHQTYPVVSGQYIVWQDETVSGNWNLYAAALPVNATVTVLSPNGSEQWLAEGKHTVQWTTSGDAVAEVKIEFSSDNGQSWTTLAEQSPNTGSAVVTVPDVSSVQCLVRISIPGTAIYDQSDTAFTVFQCAAALTADITGDCFVDLADVAELSKQWLQCGHPTDPTWCQ